MKKRVDLELLKCDLRGLTDDKVRELRDTFLIFSFAKEYACQDMRKAVNVCIRELNKRGYIEEELEC